MKCELCGEEITKEERCVISVAFQYKRKGNWFGPVLDCCPRCFDRAKEKITAELRKVEDICPPEEIECDLRNPSCPCDDCRKEREDSYPMDRGL